MKLIGYSVSRCVADIVSGKVNLDDVMLIIGRTKFDEGLIDQLITGYVREGAWNEDDRPAITVILKDLLNTARLFQPRMHGYSPRSVPYGKHWANVVQAPFDMSPASKEAWDNFVTSAALDGSYKPEKKISS